MRESLLEFANDSRYRLKARPATDGGGVVTIYNTWHDGSLTFVLSPEQARQLAEWLVKP